MGIALAVISGFILGAAAPYIYRALRGTTGWVLAMLPLGLFVYFTSWLTVVSNGGVSLGWSWVPSLGLRFSFLVDGLSLLFALLISGIEALILIYAGGYLAGDDRLGRLYALLLVFMASMLGLVLADNLLTLFVFWELTSLSSYLLIGFDHERAAARAAALQALLVTAGGGLALLVGFLLLGQAGIEAGLAPDRCFEVSQLLTLGTQLHVHPWYVPILVLVLAGAFTKSAQTPFHFWLPNAMEAPTPVSAYLHSATMVKAGVYLLARLSPVLAGSDLWFWSVTAFGAVTMVTGALLAIQESDLKRILAYSTVAALGVLVMLLGIGSPQAIAAAVTFLVAHALYKGALFLVAGGVDHATGTRDVAALSGLGKSMPMTATAAIIAALSMAGLPPLFGFIGKELLYEAVLHAPAKILLTIATVGASMLFFVVAIVVGIRPFLGRTNERTEHAHEGTTGLWIGPMVLAMVSALFGLRPAVLDQSLLSPAVEVTYRAAELAPLKLALWHGWNDAVTLSIGTLVGGIGLFLVRRRLRLPSRYLSWGPARLYELMLAGLNNFARLQTDILQSGYLRLYLLIILLSLIGLVGYTLTVRSGTTPLLDWSGFLPHEAALALLIILAAWMTVRARSRLSAIAALGVVGYCVALIYVLFGAPDLAMTQFLVETLTVILFVLVFYHLPPSVELSDIATRLRDAAVALVCGVMMATLVLLAVQTDFFPKINEFYGTHSVTEAHGRNVVNVILVDYRALDTLGEITVLAVAGIGVYALLKLRLNGEKQ
jgi:multicomponent Na+:H+ antiporter subunit A